MYSSDSNLYFTSINYMNVHLKKYWDTFYPQFDKNARLWIDIAKYFSKNRLINRAGEWSSPWETQIVPGFEMPQFDLNFSMSFEEITDQRALDIKKLIQNTNTRVAVYYSGGIDSTVCLVSLLKNLSMEELKLIDVCLSSESIIENPIFFYNHILNKLNIIDSSKLRYSDIQNQGHFAITSDQGDSIFGTELGTQMYYSYPQLLNSISEKSKSNLANLNLKISDPDVHYSQFADLLIAYFNLDTNPDFGKQFYEKLHQNILSVNVPIQSLHDFFWWYIFNIKYMECALRSSIYYYLGSDIKKSIQSTVINWFNHENYQKWSMVNNNNGEKINGNTTATYKWAARKYIYSYDKNDWYFNYKSKLSSLKNIIRRNDDSNSKLDIFSMDTNYKLYYFRDPEVKNYINEKLIQFK